MQEGRLAGAGRAEHRDELTALDAEVEAAQRDDVVLTGAIDLEDVVKLERPPIHLFLTLGLPVEAPYLHLKLSIISRYASTLSTPTGVPRSIVATRPALAR